MPIPDTAEQWLARLQAGQEALAERIARHSEQPWHTSYRVMHDEIIKRIDRMETAVIGVAKWMIGALFLIVGVLAAILGVAWKILETKPG